MEIARNFTTLPDPSKLTSVLSAARAASDSVLSALHLSPGVSLSENSAFLAALASEIVLRLRQSGMARYNCIVGDGLTRVFRYQKESLVTLKWDRLVILLYLAPESPNFPVQDPVPPPPEVLSLYSDSISYHI